jgi:hypothetical protein
MPKRWVIKAVCDTCSPVILAVGDRVHHYKTGRTGTVTELHEDFKITIKFDEMNAAGMPDGKIQKRDRRAFNLGPAPGVGK